MHDVTLFFYLKDELTEEMDKKLNDDLIALKGQSETIDHLVYEKGFFSMFSPWNSPNFEDGPFPKKPKEANDAFVLKTDKRLNTAEVIKAFKDVAARNHVEIVSVHQKVSR